MSERCASSDRVSRDCVTFNGSAHSPHLFMIDTTCCIVGGGPAGIVLGLLFARAGVSVVVLEKHNDFLRDFRGDTIHPSTLAVMDDLGLGDAFRALPQRRVETLSAVMGGRTFRVADFRRLATRNRFIALMPQ